MKKGFTLVELLAVIVVLAAISLVIIPAVHGNLNRSREQSYDVQVKNIEEAAKNWAADHIGALPDNGDTYILTLQDLQDGNYISKDLENPKTQRPFDGSLQIMIKNNNESYVYKVIES